MITRLAMFCWLILAVQAGAAEAPGTSRPESATERSGAAGLAEALGAVSGTRMLADVARLSAPDLNGRQTGTADDLHGGLLVAERLQALGLQPRGIEILPGTTLSGSWAQSDNVTVSQITGTALLEVSSGSGTHAAQLGDDFLPILDSPSVQVTAPVLFVGYGLSDPVRRFDEYAGLDAHDKVVLFLRGKPNGYDGASGLADKIRVAREKGAVAFLSVTGPVLSAYESRRGMTGQPMAAYGAGSLPGAWITPALADGVLAASGRTLRQVQERLNQSLIPQSTMTETSVHLAWERTQSPGRLVNVLGAVTGRDTGAREDIVLIGAHRDHFGRQAGLLFPGADDNASGTAILLETARVLAGSGTKPRRTVLFVSFSGEEQGLLGSSLYVRRPVVSMDHTHAMINVDHAGIGNGRLTVGVTGLSKDRAAETGRLAGLSDRLDLFGFFPGGDHVPFKEAGVATVTVVSGGPHPHFHQPSDRAETVQQEILEAAARYVLALAWRLANAE